MRGAPRVGWAAVVTFVLLVGTVAQATGTPATGAPDADNPQGRARATVLFSGEGNRLNAYDAEEPAKQTVIPSRAMNPDGLDINGQICFLPDGSRRFIAGEDTGQPNPPPGWGLFRLKGKSVGELSATQIAKMTPTYQSAASNAENYGCSVLSDGRIVTTDVGNQASGPGNGQLIIWFPPFNTGVGGVGQIPYCKLDIGIGTAQQIYVDEQDRIYVASARTETAGVLRYTGPFPTSPTAGGGCGQQDSTGAPLADDVQREQFIGPEDGLTLANGLVRSPSGGFYVSQVALGLISEFDGEGSFVRHLVEPQPGDVPLTYTFGNPLGMAIDSAGTLYYADLNLVIGDGGIGPGPDGKVWRVRFVDGDPQTPELIDDGLSFPDGLGILEHPGFRSDAPTPSTGDWRTYAGGPRRQFFNPDERYLTRDTVGSLREKWRFPTDAIITGSPTVAWVDLPGEGRVRVVYVVSWDGFIYAVRFTDGTEVWRAPWDPQPGASFPGAASVHVEKVNGAETVLVGAGETFYSLDARTGAENWRFHAGSGCVDETGAPPGNCRFGGERNEILASAIVARGRVFFAMDVNESVTGKGGVYALDVRTGTLDWYFDVTTGATCRPRPSDEVRKFDGYNTAAVLGLPEDFFASREGCDFPREPNGCGDVWSSPALDEQRGAIYLASSNCYTSTDADSPRPHPPMPPYDEAVFSLDLDGNPRWRWRPREVDNADLAFGAVPNLFSIDVDGTRRDVVGIGNKDGTYYVLDRDGVNVRNGVRWDDADPSGLPYWTRNVVPGGPQGGILATAAVDERARRVYFTTAPGTSVVDPQRPTVHALDLDTGAIVWQNTETTALEGDASFGPTSAVPSLVFAGSALAPHLRIYDAATGELLWHEVIGDPTTLGGISSGAVVIDGTLLVGSGVGTRSSNPDNPSDIASRAPSSLIALCVPTAPDC